MKLIPNDPNWLQVLNDEMARLHTFLTATPYIESHREWARKRIERLQDYLMTDGTPKFFIETGVNDG